MSSCKALPAVGLGLVVALASIAPVYAQNLTLATDADVVGGAVRRDLLHGYGETGDMWAPLASDLARDHTVVAPDLRDLGLSAREEKGFDKEKSS